jgi:GT2 family glycosyltransferase
MRPRATLTVDDSYEALQVAVCICTRNRSTPLERCLNSVTRGDPRVAEVIVSDDSTDAATKEMVTTKFPGVRYVSGPRRGLGPNRNSALRHVSAPFVLFLDDDATLGNGFLEAIARCYQSTDLAPDRTIATGVVREAEGFLPPADQRFLGYQDRQFGRKTGLTNVAMPATVFPLRLFHEIGFDERLIYGYDEVDLAVRARKRGYEIVLCEDAINDHERSPVNRDMYRHHVEAARLYVTFKRYAFAERRAAKALAFALIASVHLTGSRMKASGLRGMSESGKTLKTALADMRSYLAGPTTEGPLTGGRHGLRCDADSPHKAPYRAQ